MIFFTQAGMICTFMGGTPQTPFSHDTVLCHSKDSLLKKQINPLLHMDNLYLLNHHYISRRKRLHPMSHECCIGYILTWKLNKIGQRCTNTHTCSWKNIDIQIRSKMWILEGNKWMHTGVWEEVDGSGWRSWWIVQSGWKVRVESSG